MLRTVFVLIAFAFAVSIDTLAGQETDVNAQTATHLLRAQQFLAEQKPTLAIEEYQAVLAGNPDNLEAQANLGIVLFFQSECSEAIGHLDRALKIQPELAKLQALLGVCQKREGQIEEATRNLEASLPLVTEAKIHLLIENNLAELYYAEGNMQLASHMAEDLLRMDPHNESVLYMVYRINMDIADRARDTLALIAPDSPRMHQMMAEHLINEGDAASAVFQYERALGADPNLPGIRYELAEAILQDSKSAPSLAKATELLKEALAEEPRNAGAEAKLGEIAMIEGHNDRAKAYFAQAFVFRTDDLDALEGMADIANREGDLKEATRYLIQASREDPMDEKLHYRLSHLYRQLNLKIDSDHELDLFLKIRDLKKKTALVEQRVASQ
jgi:tetratricopeptide (TPR) repeat protein